MVFVWGSVSAKFGKTLATFGLPSPVEAFRVGPGLSHASSAWPCSRRAFGLGLAELLECVRGGVAYCGACLKQIVDIANGE
jgi:hypothetical protein